MLTALRMDAIWIQEHLKGRDFRAAERALTKCHLIDKTIADVRNLAFRLRTGILDDLGLVDALELFTTDFEKCTGITCAFEHSSIPATRETVSTAAYRIAQEALTNVARHAAAGHVDLRLGLNNGLLTLAVMDDGRGSMRTLLGRTRGWAWLALTKGPNWPAEIWELYPRRAGAHGSRSMCRWPAPKLSDEHHLMVAIA